MTVASRLTPLQERILDELAGMEPAWTLFGAGALIGFHLGHRTTRDLDLAFRPLLQLGEIPREVEARLRRVGLQVDHVHTAVSFARLRVTDATGSIEVDLVADPTQPVEPPAEPRPGVHVDTTRELLTQKLCALLSRTELEISTTSARCSRQAVISNRVCAMPCFAMVASRRRRWHGCCNRSRSSEQRKRVATNDAWSSFTNSCWTPCATEQHDVEIIRSRTTRMIRG